MNKLIKLSIVSLTLFSMIACGGSKKNPTQKTGDFPLEVDKMVNGPFSESLEVTNAVLKISENALGSKLMVEVKRTSFELPLDPNDADVCGSSSGKSYRWCISADIIGENNIPVETNMDIYGYDPFEQLLSLKNGETVWLEFSTRDHDLKDDPSKAKRVKLSSKVEYENRTISSSISFDPDEDEYDEYDENWDSILQSYEAFIDKYISLMKKAKNGDMNAISEYAEYMEKATELSKKLDRAGSNLTATQAAKFAKLQAKLANAAANI